MNLRLINMMRIKWNRLLLTTWERILLYVFIKQICGSHMLEIIKESRKLDSHQDWINFLAERGIAMCHPSTYARARKLNRKYIDDALELAAQRRPKISIEEGILGQRVGKLIKKGNFETVRGVIKQ